MRIRVWRVLGVIVLLCCLSIFLYRIFFLEKTVPGLAEQPEDLSENGLEGDRLVLPFTYTEQQFQEQHYAIVQLNTEQQKQLQVFFQDNEGERYGSIERLRQLLEAEGKELLFATNAGIFDPDFFPLGLYIEQGRVLNALNTSTGGGNFFLQPNGVFSFVGQKAQIVPTYSYAYPKATQLAVQSGPMLVLNKKIHPEFDQHSESRYIRNGVGVNAQGEVFFVLAKTPVTLYEFAEFFQKELVVDQALYLDGAISEMYISGERDFTFQPFSVMFGIVQ